MNTNNRQEALAKLHSLVDRIPSLETKPRFSEEFRKWANDARIALKWIFKNDPSAAKELEGIRYTLGAYSSNTPDSAFEDAFRRGLSSSRALLRSRIDEIQEFWPANGPEPAMNSGPAAPKDPSLVFVIHGRQGLAAFHDFLRAVGLKPLEWSQARRLIAQPNPYTWEIVDTALNNAGAIVALLTADDQGRLREDLWTDNENALEKELLFQPRQNVLFEAGVAYGRAPNRTVLVRVGSHRPMSDLAGHHIINLNNSPESRQSVADALSAAGCPIDLSGSDWFRAGDFS